MQQISTNKSFIYGAIILLIFAISSCEFGLDNNNNSELKNSDKHAQTTHITKS